MNEFNFNSYDNSKQSISYCEVDKCKAVIKLKKCLQEIKEIAEDAKDKFYDAIHTGGLYERLEQIIRKINEVEDDKSRN